MRINKLQLKRAVRAVLFVLLLSTVGMTNVFAFTVGKLNYSVNSDGVSVTVTDHVDGTAATGDHAFVDLGLPSGTLWATCNVGASTPEEYGDYFAWGETQPKDVYNWSTYQYCMGSENTLTKYCTNPNYGYNGFTDNLTILLPEDDAATANWGNGWRMPTKEEWQELYQNTTVTWTQQNGVNGRLFTASNGNSLFLPAAGARWGGDLYDVGSYGFYWSSSLGTDDPISAWYFYFSSDDYYMVYGNRHGGRSVRAVRSASPGLSYIITATANPTEGGTVSGGGTYAEGAPCTLTATPSEGYTFISWTENGEVVSVENPYTFIVDADRDLVANFVGSGDHDYIDLGLPSGLLWATCNVGANTPEEYGDYFAWGETQPKDVYNWSTYQYCMGSNNTLTKYCTDPNYGYNGFTDNLTILLSEDDAATANWGNGWRMPTKEEWQELYQNTTVTWTQQNGVNGRLFTASNGNSLFLPAAGARWGGDLYDVGSYGFYWSSSLGTRYPDYAWGFHFYSYYYDMYGYDRYYGLSVRAVRSSGQEPIFGITATPNPEEGGAVSGGGAYAEGAPCSLTATPAEGYSFMNWTENGEVVSTDAEYSFTVTCDRDLVANFVEIGSGDHDYVDLGLPSGTLWATCNVGANTPEEYGDYFAWGETQPKDVYNWSTYQYCMGSNNTLTKYCSRSDYGYNGFTDNLTILLPEDDAATANWGNEWRMPTKEEWQELYQNTTVTWTQQNGVNGRLFTASNGSSLFLPAAGFRWDSDLYHVGSGGFYWSSSLYTVNPYSAWYFIFHSDGYNMTDISRDYGPSVRAVRSAGQELTFGITATPNPVAGGAVSGGGAYAEGAPCTLTATPAEGYTFINWTENGEVVSTEAEYSFTVTCDRDLVANFEEIGSGDHDYVDLGLPSGTLWATCNVGANTPEEYGDYYAWGETQPKDVYNWSTYQYCMGSYNTLTKYCTDPNYGYNGFTDNLTILLPEDDAATANWGNGWRMPTEEEWQELYQNTTVTWTQQNGVNGRLFTASNGSSLFLPAAGFRLSSSLYLAGGIGEYWSRSLGPDYPDSAWRFGFGSGGYSVYDDSRRDYGRSVRAVRSAGQELTFGITATPNPVAGGAVSGGGAYAEGAPCTLTATPSEGYTFINWTENGEVVSIEAEYSFTVTCDRDLVANFEEIGSGDHDYVDLGLPSGLLWATCNVGANAPEEYGDYFAWGETQPKNYYKWSTYKYCKGSYYTLTKYCNKSNYGYNGYTDTLTILLPDDDAATANWGNEWRMPTEEEWQELYQNTTVTWTQQNGVNGRLFTASNGSSLFLPAAGGRWDSDLYNVGSYGYYWSGSLSTDGPYGAWLFFFSSDTCSMGYNNRFSGQSVRAVRSAGQELTFGITATANPVAGGAVSGGGAYAEGAPCTLTATPAEGYTFINWTENGEVVSTKAEYSFTVTGDRDLVANFEEIGGDDHDYVDLGLPSGLMWATCNVGANTPEEYGDYFAWGETQPKDVYNWSTYQYCMGSYNTLTKYCSRSDYGYNGFTDNLTVLLPEDDAATANWGNGWRMPTQEEWQELLDNTTYTWTTQNGVNGRLFTAPNGNSLFLPAAGYRWDDELYSVGSYGYYWSSSLYTDYPYLAWSFNFNSGYCSVGSGYRYDGHSVRAVRSAGQELTFGITATPNPVAGGAVSGGGAYAEGAPCTLTATPAEGYTFINWTENGEVVSTDAEYSFTVTCDRNLVANFSQNTYTISASAIPSSSGSVSGAGNYYYGDTCTLTATPNTGFSFVRWTKNGTHVSTNATYSFTVTENASCVAYFRVTSYTISASANPTEGGTVNGGGTYHYGNNCTLTATANEDYTFVNWTENGTEVSTNAIYSFTVTGNRNLVANFTSDSGGYYWTVNVNQYPNTMTAIGVILINDVEQMTSTLELGVFCGTECRGRERLAYISQIDRYLLFLTMYGENGDVLNFRLYDHALGEELDVICTNSVTFATNNTLGTVVSPYEFSFMEGIQTQTSSLPEGWSWWSTYIEQEGIDGLTQLENSLGENGVMIKSQSEGFTSRYGDYWFGLLNSINNESSYLVQTSGSCDVSLTGHVAVPSEHPITLLPGWTWIGYPNNTAMSVSTALSNLNPSENDMLKAQESFSVYYPSIGWFGSLQTIMPGMGLMYESHNTSSVTLTYSNPTRTDDLAENVTARTNHWNPDVYAYPNNMNVMAVVEVNGEELQSEDYELAAFANGECRGSAKLMYVEQLHRHMAFLTLHGDDETELSFGLYDNATGMTAYKSDARLIFTANAVAGSPDNPMVVSFSDMTGIDSFGGTLHVFPNPVERGSMITIGKVEESGEVRVEIMNALGAVLSTETSTRLPANIKAPEVPGVYMLRISSKGRGIRYVKLIVS